MISGAIYLITQMKRLLHATFEQTKLKTYTRSLNPGNETLPPQRIILFNNRPCMP